MPSLSPDVPPIENEMSLVAQIFRRLEDHEEVVNYANTNLLLSQRKTPFFLRNVLCPHEKTIFVQKPYKTQSIRSEGEEIRSSSTPMKMPTICMSKRRDSSGEYIGSPLEVQFDSFDESMEFGMCDGDDEKKPVKKQFSFSGFNVAKTRKLIPAIQELLKTIEDASFAVVVPCDCKDPQKTLLMGTCSDGTSMSTTVSGPHTDVSNLPTVDDYISSFQFGVIADQIETTAEAIYDLYGTPVGKSTFLSVVSKWKRPFSMLTSPSLDAASFVDIDVCLDDAAHSAHEMYLEFAQLSVFVEALQTGEISWSNKKRSKTVIEELEELFQEIRSRDPSEKDEAPESLDHIIKSNFCNLPANTSFTGQIWLALCNSTSLKNLCDNITYIFDSISNNTVTPQIDITDPTQMADLCRKLMQGKPTHYNLEEESLKMLVEIGLRKLQQDYLSIFQVGELITYDQALDFTNANFPLTKPELCLQLVKRLNVALHVAVLLRNRLDIPQTTLLHCTSHIFEQMKTGQNIPLRFRFPIQTSLVHETLESLEPKDWKLGISDVGSNSPPSKTMDIYLSSEPLFKSLTAHGIDETVIEDKDCTSYYMTVTSYHKDTLVC